MTALGIVCITWGTEHKDNNMDSMTLRGLGIAMITPFDKDKQIDFAALGRLIDYVVENGANYLVILGTTGETPTLTHKERESGRRFAVEYTAGRVPLIVGMGGNCTAALIEELKNTDLSGYSAILSVAPFYNKPSQQGLYEHYAAIAKNSPLPVILYNVPGRTGVNISADTTIRLARDFSNIIAVKEASGNFRQIEDILNNCPENFQVISGDDALTYPLIALGAVGVISVVGNAFPHMFGDMVRRCLAGDFKNALPVHYQFERLYEELFVDGNPAGIKYVLHEMGFIENELRLPLVPTRRETRAKLDQILDQISNAHNKSSHTN